MPTRSPGHTLVCGSCPRTTFVDQVEKEERLEIVSGAKDLAREEEHRQRLDQLAKELNERRR